MLYVQCSQSYSEVISTRNTQFTFFWTCKISYTRAWWQCWLCALTCECRGSFVTSQRLLHGHCCPPQMTLAASQGISVSSAALHAGRSVRCNCAWSDTRPCAHYSWTVAAASQKYRNIRCLQRRYIHVYVNRRRLLRYQDQLRRWMWSSFLRDRDTGVPVCTLRVLVCTGSHRGYHLGHWHNSWNNMQNALTKSTVNLICIRMRITIEKSHF